MTALLEARGLVLRHPRAEVDAVRDLHLSVDRGEILALVGPNGSGKSTTLAGLGRALAPRHGELLLDGVNAWTLPRRRFATRVARLPQEPRCPEGLTVTEVIAAGRHPHVPWLRGWSGEDRRACAQALEALDLDDLRQRPVETLSGGERRRVWIAMVLSQRAEVILMDEPTNSLDLRHRWEVLDLLERINHERGVTLVVVLHDLAEAERIADRVAVFHRGRLYAAGDPAPVLSAGTLSDVFRVEARRAGSPARPRLDALGPANPIRSL